MILGNVTRILKEDLSRYGAVPSWIEGVIGPINNFLSSVTLALRNNLTFRDNFDCREVVLTFTHGVELSVNPQTQKKVRGLLPLEANNAIIDKYGFRRKADGQVGITFYFDAGTSSTQVSVTFILLF